MKFKSVAISTSYLNLSTLSFPPKAAGTAGYFPNDRRLISLNAPVIINNNEGAQRTQTAAAKQLGTGVRLFKTTAALTP